MGFMGKRGPKPQSIGDRFWPKVEIGDPEDCWKWLGTTFGDGRPSFYLPSPINNGVGAFRVGYELAFGPIEPGLDLDHLCNNSWCVNPNHCVPATPWENRGRSGREVTHCPAGHPYDEANTHWYRGKRRCRACNNDRRKAFLAEKAIREGRIPGIKGRPWYMRKE